MNSKENKIIIKDKLAKIEKDGEHFLIRDHEGNEVKLSLDLVLRCLSIAEVEKKIPELPHGFWRDVKLDNDMRFKKIQVEQQSVPVMKQIEDIGLDENQMKDAETVLSTIRRNGSVPKTALQSNLAYVAKILMRTGILTTRPTNICPVKGKTAGNSYVMLIDHAV